MDVFVTQVIIQGCVNMAIAVPDTSGETHCTVESNDNCSVISKDTCNNPETSG